MRYPTANDAMSLFMEGAVALCDVEESGMRIDVDYLSDEIETIEDEIDDLKEGLRESEAGELWSKKFRARTNFDSDDQLASVLFDELELESTVETKSGNRSVSEGALEGLGHSSVVRNILKIRKLQKLHGTYLTGILREQVDGYIHSFFSLHNIQSYRSGSSLPNLQNVPSREPEIMGRIRKAFIPSDGNCLVEVDYGSLEVRISACYHKDPTMVKYIQTDYDMHRDMAAECYKLPKDQVSKMTRFYGKSKFVFPQFYGSYWKQCAPSLWSIVDVAELKTESGKSLRKHLKSVGLDSYKRFENHIKEVEEDFWSNRFEVYAGWKDEWHDAYLEKGFFDTLTGFRCSGEMSRNQVINYPVQGSAFHCLLWSLIQLNKEFVRLGMDTVIVNQIHDSLLFDVPMAELDDLCDLCVDIMTKKVANHWRWINVPLAIEIEATPEDGSWNEKQEIQLDAS